MCVAWSTWQIAWYKALKTQQNALKCLEQDYRCSSPALAFPCSLLQREKCLEKHQYVLPVIKTRSNGRRRSNKSYCGWPCCTWDQFFLSHPALGIGWALHEQEIAGLVLPSSQPGNRVVQTLPGPADQLQRGKVTFLSHVTLSGTFSNLIKLSVIIVFITLRSRLAPSSTDHKVNTASLNRNNRFWFN